MSVLPVPLASIEPVSPKRLFTLEISRAGGLALGILLARLLEPVTGRVRTADELSRIASLPYLGWIRAGESNAI